jgi:PKD repeat protein
MNARTVFLRSLMVASVLALVIILLRGDLVMNVHSETSAPPTADAGADQRVAGPALVEFDGTGSSDDVGVTQYLWEFTHGNRSVQLEGPNPEFTFQVHGVYQVSLTVTDGDGQTDMDSMELTVVTVPGDIEQVTVIGRNGWVEIAWDEPVHDGGSPIVGSLVYRGTDPDSLEPYYSDWWIRGWSWDYLAVNGITYYYAVAAINEIGMGPLSPIANATPMAVPDSPQNLTVQVVDGEVHLEWDPPLWSSGRVDVTGYQVHRGTDPEWLYDTFDVGLNTSFVDPDVEEGVTYYYVVGADSSFGGSSVTDVANVTVGEAPSEEADWVVGALATTLVVAVLAVFAAALYYGLRWKG